MELAMSVAQREEFLSDVHVGVFGAADPRGGDRAPLLVPVWYGYTPGGTVTVLTGRDSVKARLIRETGRFSLCAQSESAPYRYVSVEGPAVVEDRIDPEERAALAHRYLDPVTAEAYLDANAHQLTGDVTARMRPVRWRTADFNAFAKEFS